MTKSKGITLLCGFLLVGSVAFYFYKQNVPEPEPVIIYKATTPTPKTVEPTVATPQEQAHNHSGHDPQDPLT